MDTTVQGRDSPEDSAVRDIPAYQSTFCHFRPSSDAYTSHIMEDRFALTNLYSGYALHIFFFFLTAKV